MGEKNINSLQLPGILDKLTFVKSDGTIANAEQLLSNQMVEDQTPYLFRTSGGSMDIGNREYLRKLVGGTLGWNQLVQSDYKSASKTFASSDTYHWAYYNNVSIPVSAGHKVLASAKITRSISGNDFLGLVLDDTTATATVLMLIIANGASNGNVYTIAEVPNNATAVTRISANNYSGKKGFDSGDSVGYDNLQVIDLTTLFGSTIADYIYSLEQTTEGSGVAWLKKYFPNLFEYHEYSEPTLKSVEGLVSHDTVGFNQWDEEWELGYIKISDGQNDSSSSNIRSKNYIKVVPNTTYFARTKTSSASDGIKMFYYDSDKNFISCDDGYQHDTTFTTPSNCHFVRFYRNAQGGSTYNNDICINLSWSGTRNGEYEPYEKHSYPLDSSVTLRGIPKLDANNQLYFDGDEYQSDGHVTRRYGIVDLGTLDWVLRNGLFRVNLDPAYKQPTSTSTKTNAVCAIYENTTWQAVGNVDKEYAFATSVGTPEIVIKDSTYTSAASFKTAMSGVYLVYELATPTTESAQPYEELQIVNDFGTEEFVTSGLVPVGNVTEYPANLRDKLQHLPDLADGDGFYLIQQVGTQMELVAFHIPKATGLADGTYTLKATVSGGTPTYTWESD